MSAVLSEQSRLTAAEVRRLWAVELLAGLAHAATWPLMVVLGAVLALDGLERGLLISTFGIGQFLSGLIAGKMCDRLGKRTVLVASVALLVPTWLLAATHPTVLLVSIAQMLTGMSWTCFTASGAFVGAHIPAERRTRTFAQMYCARGFGFALGPLLGGLLMAHGTGWVGGMITLCAAASAGIALLGLRESRVAAAAPSDRPILKGARIPRAARGPLLGLTALGAAMAAMCYYVPIHAQEGLRADPALVSGLFSCLGLTMVLAPGFLWLSSRWPGEHRTAVAAFVLVAVTALACALASTSGLLVTAFLVWALAWDVTNPLIRSRLSQRTSGSEQARVMAVVQWSGGLLNLGVPPLAGLAYSAGGALPLFGAAAAVLALGAFAIWVPSRCSSTTSQLPLVPLAAA